MVVERLITQVSNPTLAPDAVAPQPMSLGIVSELIIGDINRLNIACFGGSPTASAGRDRHSV